MEYTIMVLNAKKKLLLDDISLPIENWKIKSKRLDDIKNNIRQLEEAIEILKTHDIQIRMETTGKIIDDHKICARCHNMADISLHGDGYLCPDCKNEDIANAENNAGFNYDKL